MKAQCSGVVFEWIMMLTISNLKDYEYPFCWSRAYIWSHVDNGGFLAL